MGQRGHPRYPDLLTPREQEVLALVREGLTNEQLALRLEISFETAKHHVSEILSKLAVATREEAAAWQPGEAARWTVGRIALAVGGAAVVAAAVVGLGVLTWGVLEADEGEDDNAVAASPTPPGLETPAKTPLTTGPPRPLPTLPPGFNFEAKPGRQYFPGYYLIDPSSGSLERYLEGETSDVMIAEYSVSPDGRWLAAPLDGTKRPGVVLLQDLAGSPPPVEITLAEYVYQVAVSSSGQLAVSARVNGVEGVYIRDPSTGEALRVNMEGGGYELQWASSGQTLYFQHRPGGASSTFYAVESNNTNLRPIRENLRPAVLSPDGSLLAGWGGTASLSDFLILDTAGNEVLRKPNISAGQLAWSPGNSRLAFTANSTGLGYYTTSEIRVVDVATLEETVVASGTNPDWSQDGLTLAFERGGQIYTVGGSGGVEVQVTDASQPFASRPTWLAGNRLLFSYASPFSAAVYVAAADGDGEARIAEGSDILWSPNGEQIAFTGWNRGGEYHVYVARPDGSDMRKVGGYFAGDAGPFCFGMGSQAWSHDNKWLAIQFRATGLASIDGSQPPRVVDGCPAAWSPADATLAYSGSCNSPPDLSVECLKIEREPGVVETHGEGTGPSFSPDGSLIALTRHGMLMLFDLEDGEETPITEFPVQGDPDNPNIYWSADGEWLAVSTWMPFVIRKTGGKQTGISDGQVVGWSPDGQVLVKRFDGSGIDFIDPATAAVTRTFDAQSISFSPDGSQVAFTR